MGKKTVIIVVALIVVAIAILASWGKINAVLMLVAAVLAIVFWGLRSIDGTLEAHPELALLDGTEIVALRKAEMAAKGMGALIQVEATPVRDPIALPPSEGLEPEPEADE